MSKPLYMPGKKGAPKVRIEDAETKDLKYWSGRLAKGLEEDPDKDYAEQDIAKLNAMRAELARRDGGGTAPASNGNGQQRQQPQPAHGQSRALARPQVDQVVAGSFSNPDAATAALMKATEQYHLVSPATVVGRLPEGCEVAISLVQIDPYGPEVYGITGSKKNPKDDDTVGIDRTGLARIAAAMGVSWLVSRRTDDGSHPHYCAWEVWGEYPGFDLQPQRVSGNVDIDTREDGAIRGAAAEEIRSKAERRRRLYPDDDNDDGDGQLLELRKFLLRHAESKAMNRAIANRGVRRSYKRHELKKPFAVARLMFTGHSEDPEARREFRQMIGERFMGARSAMYGGAQQPVAAPAALPASQAPSQAPVLQSPPPLSASARQDYDRDTEGDSAPEHDAPQQPAPAAAPPQQAAAPQPADTPPGQQPLVGDGYDNRDPRDPNAY